MEKIVLISIGAVFGALSRHFVSDWAAQRWGNDFPFGILLINVTGSLLIGFLLTIALNKYFIDPRWRLLFIVGYLGSFTTFSSLMYDSVHFIHQGEVVKGLMNISISVVSGIFAAGLGIFFGYLI